MHLRLEHHFAAAPSDVAAAYASAELYDVLGGDDRLAAPELVERSVDGDVVTTGVRWRFVGDLAPAVRAVLDPTRLTWVERCTHDLAALEVRFELLPDHYPDRLRCAGTRRFRPSPDGGCDRSTEAELKVRAPLVGGTVEKVLARDIAAHQDGEVAEVDAHLAG